MDDDHDGWGMMHFPDAGKNRFNELFYARRFLNKVPLRTHEKDWYVYNGRCWERQKRAYFEPFAWNLLPEQFREVEKARKVLDAVQMQQQLTRDQRFASAIRFDLRGDVLINCYNGVLRVPTNGEPVLAKHDSELLFTGCLAASWEPMAGCDLFQRVVTEVLPDIEDRKLLQWFVGYMLYPSCKHEVFLISHGTGGSGKSTVSDAVMAVVGGKPLRTVLSMSQICAEGQGAYSLPLLEHAMVNMGTELDTVDIGDSANFKRIVSGEPINVRPIYGEPFDMTDYSTKLWFNSNSLPRFRHGTDAELRRARFLEFVHSPKAKDVTVKERLLCEKSGILVWMVAGLQAILRGEECPEGSKESRRVKAKFAISNDPVTAWARECLDFDVTYEETKDDVWESFNDYLGSWGFTYKSKETLFRQFYERFPEVSAWRQKYEFERTDGSKRGVGQWVMGVRVREPYDGPSSEV